MRWRHTLLIAAAIAAVSSVVFAAKIAVSVVQSGLSSTLTLKGGNVTNAIDFDTQGTSGTTFRFRVNGTTKAAIDASAARVIYTGGSGDVALYSADGNLNGILTNGNDLGFRTNAALYWTMSGATFYSSDGAGQVGTQSARLLSANALYMAPSGSAAEQPTCDSTKRGAIMVVRATAGNSDTLQACVKSAADTYAWSTVFTAP